MRKKIVVKDYSREVIDKYKVILLDRIGNSEELDAWKFAEEENIEIELSLTCFDELISEGKLKRVDGERD